MNPYFSNKNFNLYLGDCLELLKKFKDNSVDLIFADPPYFLSSGSFTCQNGRMVSVKKGDWDMGGNLMDNFNFHNNWISECRRILKSSGSIWISGTYHSIYQCGFALQKNNYKILNEIIWYKPNASPNLSCRFFTASHETLIWARKEAKNGHKFNYSISKENDWSNDFLKKPGLQMRSVWAIGTPKPNEKIFGKHPTQKPLELLERIILTTTEKGDIVLDPFTGSSTTGLVACKNGRKFWGIDTEKEYLELSIKRYNLLEKR